MTDPTASLDATLAALDRRLTTVEQGQTALQGQVTAQQSAVEALQGTDVALGTAVEDLDARVTALEAGGGGTPPDPEPPTDQSDYLPVSYANLDAALAAGLGGGRSKDKFVLWPSNPAAGWSLEDQFRAMADWQILVLPERSAVYPIDSTDGFVASGVDYCTDTSLPSGQQKIDISDKWHGKGGRGWFSMTRVTKGGGILGLGPGAVVEPTDSGFTRPAQGDETQLSYTNLSGQTYAMNGCAEGLIDTSSDATYFGNFTMKGRDFGAVAYNGIRTKDAIIERMHFDRCWRGHSHAPNGETGGWAGRTPTRLTHSTFTCTGVGRSKTSVLMANGSASALLEKVFISDDAPGSVTFWNSVAGAQITWNDVHCPYSCNHEANQAGYKWVMTGGLLGRTGQGYHVNVRSPYGSQRLELHGVALPGPAKPTFNVWGSGPYMQKKSDCLAWDQGGNVLAVTVAGNTAPE